MFLFFLRQQIRTALVYLDVVLHSSYAFCKQFSIIMADNVRRRVVPRLSKAALSTYMLLRTTTYTRALVWKCPHGKLMKPILNGFLSWATYNQQQRASGVVVLCSLQKGRLTEAAAPRLSSLYLLHRCRSLESLHTTSKPSRPRLVIVVRLAACDTSFWLKKGTRPRSTHTQCKKGQS